jgi:hypothetical protein
MNPVADKTGFITIEFSSRSPDGAKRNPGTINSLNAAPDFIRATKKERKGSGTP